MRFNRRKAFFGVLIAGAMGAVLFPPAIYYLGLALAPPRPIPSKTQVPPVLAAALWARADGGRATALTPLTPVTAAQFAACIAWEDFRDTTPGDARRVQACRGYMPAIQALEYFSGMHMRDANLKPSFREGLARFSTTAWMTHSWTKAELVATLAERGEFAHGFRGVDAAAQGYFGRSVDQLTLAQAALLGAFIGDRITVDPWCDPAGAAERRRRILERMRDDAVIDEAAYQSAHVTELGLTTPPATHKPCEG